jgi:hypothetical protein
MGCHQSVHAPEQQRSGCTSVTAPSTGPQCHSDHLVEGTHIACCRVQLCMQPAVRSDPSGTMFPAYHCTHAAGATYGAALAHDDADTVTEGCGDNLDSVVVANGLIELPDLCAQLVRLVCVWPALQHVIKAISSSHRSAVM